MVIMTKTCNMYREDEYIFLSLTEECVSVLMHRVPNLGANLAQKIYRFCQKCKFLFNMSVTLHWLGIQFTMSLKSHFCRVL